MPAGPGFGVRSYSAAPTVYGSIAARFGALIIDGLVGIALAIPGYVVLLGGAANGSEIAILGFPLLLGGAIFNVVQYCRKMGRDGQSIGYKVCGIRLVDATTGASIGAGRAFGRAIVRGLAAIPCYLGLFWALWQPQRRGWHDLASNTVVVPAEVPFTGSTAASPYTSPAYGAPSYAQPLLDAPGAPPPAPAPSVPPAPAPSAFAAPARTPTPPTVYGPGPAPSFYLPPSSVDDDRTVARSDLRSSPPPSTPVPTATQRRFAVVFDSGRREAVDQTLVVGRDPAPSPADGRVALIAIDDSTMSVSKTHFAIGRDLDALWVEDRHSTNGVSVITGSDTTKLAPGVRSPLATGAVVRFGDRSLSVVSE